MKTQLTRDEKLSRLITDFLGNPDCELFGEADINENVLNYLPEDQADLTEYAVEIIPTDLEKTASPSRIMGNHYEKLRYEFRGKPEILALLALSISYLRRHTTHDEQAKSTFFNILDNHWESIKYHINARWLLASLRTVVEFGRSEQDRTLALSGYVYGTLIRNYETERKLDGLPSDSLTFDLPLKSKSTDIPALGNYVIGRDNGASIINVLMVQTALNETVIGEMVLCLMSEIKHGKTIFSRVDTQIAKLDTSRERPRTWGFGPSQDEERIGMNSIEEIEDKANTSKK